MTKLINIQFKRTAYADVIIANDKDYPTYIHGYLGVSKVRLRKALKRQMRRFYPGITFIFNFAK